MCKIYLAVLILAIISEPFAAHGCIFRRRAKRVHIVNLLPENSQPLKLHCASGDDDLGFHDINVGEHYEWKFCPSFLGTTLFFCHFWWGPKEATFDVYDHKNTTLRKHLNVFAAKSDGIYLANDFNESSLLKHVS
ncbi:hypothetical protein AAHA92_08119 [Salvia divinorum]|uniref:S-protein homolog n=1 Tax=Salvia divinorum TaxID=28513 RepID=A0ABD1HQQ7_SALDI